MHKTGNGKWRRIFAPLYVMKEEKLYCIWIVFVCFFGLMNIWAGLLLWQFDSIVKSLREGIVYTYSISICAPFLAALFHHSLHFICTVWLKWSVIKNCWENLMIMNINPAMHPEL